MYRGNNIIGLHRVAVPPTTTTTTTGAPTTTTTTTGAPTTTTTTTLGPQTEIYFGSVDSGYNAAVLAVNNQNGKTFDIKFKYSVDASCDNEGNHGDYVNAYSYVEISINGGATWTQIDDVSCSVPGGNNPPFSNYSGKTGYTTVTGISVVPNVMVRGHYDYESGQDAQNGDYAFTIYAVTAHTGSAIIICDNYASAGGTDATVYLSCTIAPTTTTTTTAGPITTTTTLPPTTTTTTTLPPTTTTTTTIGPTPTFETHGHTGVNPMGITSGAGNIWTTNVNDYGGSVTEVSPSWVFTKYTGSTFAVMNYPSDIIFDGNNLWISAWHQMVKMTTGGVTTPYQWGNMRDYRGIVYDNSNCTFWVSMGDTVNESMWYVKQFCAATGALMCTILNQSSNIGAYGLAMNTITGDLWTANQYNASVSRITQAGVVTKFCGTGSAPTAIAFDGTNMWTSNAESGSHGSVSKISPSGTITNYSGVGSCPHGIAFDGTNMWTSNTCSNNISKITSSGSISTYGSTGSKPWGITFDGTYLWTSNYADCTVTKITI
jgi:hypothetical protein